MTINTKNIKDIVSNAIKSLIQKSKEEKFIQEELSICCGVPRSYIYPRDCWQCGALFIARKTK